MTLEHAASAAEHNAEVAVTWLGIVSDGEFERMLDFATPDAVWWMSFRREDVPLDGMVAGFTASRKYIFSVGVRFAIDSVTADESRVSIEAHGTSTKLDGTQYDNIYHFLFDFVGGKVRKVWEYADTEAAELAFEGQRIVARPPHLQ